MKRSGEEVLLRQEIDGLGNEIVKVGLMQRDVGRRLKAADVVRHELMASQGVRLPDRAAPPVRARRVGSEREEKKGREIDDDKENKDRRGGIKHDICFRALITMTW